jgi:radical SAM superfamily enzyme YgiQ (UPF0313 family)
MPNSFWSYQEALDLAGLRATSPPLGLITVAALLPSDWEIKLVDRNICLETDADWDWCDLVIISAMIVQKQDFTDLIQKGVALGKKVAVGGPFATSVPEVAIEAGADYLILDEGECTIPLFLAALSSGEEKGIFRSLEKPDVTQTPIPRFDLLDVDAYMSMTLQFSRGCPFQCEFCDIITLFGRKPRTKTPAQMVAEIEALYQIGWKRFIFIVDDNFIGNKRNAKLFLRELIPWMKKHKYPFPLITEASLNLAEDDELIKLMVEAGFTMVFMGIETPDVASLVGINKEQNTRQSLVESCNIITRAGLQIMAGFILGFDNEQIGAGGRIEEFVEKTGILQAHISLLQALPNTAMWTRLQKEERLLEGFSKYFTSQKALMNFIPTRPMAEIIQEFIATFWNLYEPLPYLKRSFRHFMMMEAIRPRRKHKLTMNELRFVLAIFWRQGILRSTRWLFWWQLVAIAFQKYNLLFDYLIALGVGEHLFAFRHEIKTQLEEQLADLELIPPPAAASYLLVNS